MPHAIQTILGVLAALALALIMIPLAITAWKSCAEMLSDDQSCSVLSILWKTQRIINDRACRVETWELSFEWVRHAACNASIAPFNCRSTPAAASSYDHGIETSGVTPFPSICVPLALTYAAIGITNR
jgi:hypothetical protein